jgi:chemosensory pili system protein ChpC
MASAEMDVRSVLVPLAETALLLPNAVMSELTDYRTPRPMMRDYADWLAGSITWRQRSIPLVRFERLLERDPALASYRRRIVICQALNPEARQPFYGLVTTGIPRLLRVGLDNLQLLDPVPGNWPVAARVRVLDSEALLPDFDQLESLLDSIGTK